MFPSCSVGFQVSVWHTGHLIVQTTHPSCVLVWGVLLVTTSTKVLDLYKAYTHIYRQLQEACNVLLINIFCKHIDCCFILLDFETVISKVYFWLISNLWYIIQGQLQKGEQLLWNNLLSHYIRHNYNYANLKRCLRHIWEISPFNVIRSWFRTTAAYPNNKATGARQLFSERACGAESTTRVAPLWVLFLGLRS